MHFTLKSLNACTFLANFCTTAGILQVLGQHVFNYGSSSVVFRSFLFSVTVLVLAHCCVMLSRLVYSSGSPARNSQNSAIQEFRYFGERNELLPFVITVNDGLFCVITYLVVKILLCN